MSDQERKERMIKHFMEDLWPRLSGDQQGSLLGTASNMAEANKNAGEGKEEAAHEHP